MDNPPCTSSPCVLLALEGGGESTPRGDQVPHAPELPAILQQALKCFQEKEAAEALGGDLLRDRMGQSLGEFLDNSLAFLSQAEARMKEEIAHQDHIFANRETTLNQELSSLRQSEKETKKLLFDKGQETLQLDAKILPLRNRVIDLEEQAEGAKAKMPKLEERATQQEVQLGRVEGELAQQTELFKKTEAKLIEDVADVYGAGFEDAFAQVACVHPEMDINPFVASKRVVDGQLAPRI